MAISDKLNYLIETKSHLKDMINYGLDDENKITSSTTFRNYVKSVFKAFLESLNNPDTLFTNLPKITGTGSNITLNDTANAPMRIMLNATEITQDGTPTPDSPQDIHTISGDNTLKVNGKNLYNVFNQNDVSTSISIDEDGWISATYDNSSGTSTVIRNCKMNINNGLKPNTTYRMFLEVKNVSGTGRITINEGNNNASQFQTGAIYSYSDLTNNTTIYKDLITWSSLENRTLIFQQYLYWTAGQSGSIKFRISLIEDTSVTPDTFTYEPYISQEADIDLGNNILDLVKDKNFFEHPAGGGYATYRLTDDKAIYLVGGSTGWGWSYTNCQIKQTLDAGTYTISISQPSYEAKIYDSDNTQLKTTIATPQTITLSQTATVGIGIKVEGKSPVYVQIEKGSKGTQIFPYDKQINYSKKGNYKNEFIRTSGLNLIGLDTQQYKLNLKAGDKIYARNTTSTALTLNLYTNYGDTTRNDYWSVSANGSRVITVANDSNAIAWATAVASDGVAWVSYGETATDYEPYGTNEWYIKNNIYKKVFDGSESNWTLYTSYNNEKFVYSHWNTNYGLGFGTSLCTRFKNRNYAWADYGNIGEYSDHPSQTAKFFVTDQSSVENWKTWLSNNNITLYYVMKNPTYTKITGTLAEQLEYVYQLLKSYKGVTNISQVNNDLPFELDVEAVEDLI